MDRVAAANGGRINGNGNGRHRPAKTAPNSETLDRLVKLDAEHFANRARNGGPTVAGQTYMAGESNRMNPAPAGIDPLGTDADYHYRSARNFYLMIERARAAVRNHPLVEQAINRLLANLGLDQIRLDATTGDRSVDEALRSKWETWGADKQAVDFEAQRDWPALVNQSFFSQVADGDVLHVPLYGGQLQTWEAHHIRTPWNHRPTGSSKNGIIHGAVVRNGRTVGWHVTPHHLTYAASVARLHKTRFLPQYVGNDLVAFYGAFTHRFGQRRGVSRLSPAQQPMQGFDDLNYAHIKSALRRALISYLMESNTPPGPPVLDGAGLPQAGDRYAQDVGLGLQEIIVEQAGEPAQVFKPPPGYSMKGWNANLPGAGFFEQAALLLTCLSVNLDLPLSFLLLDGSLVNFHGGRMTWDQVKLRLTQLQRHVIATRHLPTYRWKLRQWLTPGHPEFDKDLAAAARRVDLAAVKFRPRGWPYVKPMEDAAAEDLAESRNLRSRRSILAARGEDIDETDETIISDRAAFYAKSITAARTIAGENEDLELDVVRVAAELRYGGGNQAGVQLTLGTGGETEAQTRPNQPQGATE